MVFSLCCLMAKSFVCTGQGGAIGPSLSDLGNKIVGGIVLKTDLFFCFDHQFRGGMLC